MSFFASSYLKTSPPLASVRTLHCSWGFQPAGPSPESDDNGDLVRSCQGRPSRRGIQTRLKPIQAKSSQIKVNQAT